MTATPVPRLLLPKMPPDGRTTLTVMEQASCPPCEEGAPAWVTTFADLMSLLMCFFVLLLSFAQIDAEKFKQIAGSMRSAFGVQSSIEATEVPKGTSIIAQEFSPGKVDDNPSQDIMQHTQDETRKQLAEEAALLVKRQDEAREKAEELRQALGEEIREGMLSVETDGEKVVVRIQEKGAFPSGSANLDPGFMTVMQTIIQSLVDTTGQLIVSGHTDDIPIATEQYRSNWDLSSARAVSVVHQLVRDGAIQAGRVLVEGRADTQPLVPNDSQDNRARNRRVEIILLPEGAPRENEPVRAPVKFQKTGKIGGKRLQAVRKSMSNPQ